MVSWFRSKKQLKNDNILERTTLSKRRKNSPEDITDKLNILNQEIKDFAPNNKLIPSQYKQLVQKLYLKENNIIEDDSWNSKNHVWINYKSKNDDDEKSKLDYSVKWVNVFTNYKRNEINLYLKIEHKYTKIQFELNYNLTSKSIDTNKITTIIITAKEEDENKKYGFKNMDELYKKNSENNTELINDIKKSAQYISEKIETNGLKPILEIENKYELIKEQLIPNYQPIFSEDENV